MKKRKKGGFTLVEMAIVLFIISLLILIVVPNVGKQRGRAISINDRALQTELNSQVELYKDEHNLKDSSSITLSDLKKDGYLNNAQIKQIQKEGLKIGKGDD
ncbi:prepilin-type N-terminal cleavage/methylation domain-containing protein [Ligilactobacillus pobuzihii]|uniref:prepilin-type N-terminal cleavage/methylation domain-containing protein n=1 Tax=Ligilactobacillus pobuzihii TaxID=449659 RepID=UPI0019D01B23|nr:prepilin-type N-terminal cleavage/methylation domain-containing protein [Ligilactobacillus pobuzihii]MBN7274725.1 prepilin-type N-terminal cleavage/methylation domain-containing protein [Ligilactobacillus pobuzihii]HIZ95209.1 prepilin-type N-terminal cleavage/methylation domain-containing protein [Candidatus Ligilactobacillus excrementavium]